MQPRQKSLNQKYKRYTYPELLHFEALAIALRARRTTQVLETEDDADDFGGGSGGEVDTGAAVEA